MILMREIDLGALDFLDLATEILERGDRLRFRAHGCSMTPFIRDGDLVEVEPVSAEDVALGDILFLHDARGTPVVHRAIGRLHCAEGVRILPKGDAHMQPDTPVDAGQVLGRVVALEGRGRRIDLRTGRRRLLGRIWALLSPYSRWLYPVARCFSVRRRK
ncbi:MAG: hypothetical protein GXP41_08355 [Chloroflexi bacterium]|nr:hypothetical protein [Chloroflexota bacterium]